MAQIFLDYYPRFLDFTLKYPRPQLPNVATSINAVCLDSFVLMKIIIE